MLTGLRIRVIYSSICFLNASIILNVKEVTDEIGGKRVKSILNIMFYKEIKIKNNLKKLNLFNLLNCKPRCVSHLLLNLIHCE